MNVEIDIQLAMEAGRVAERRGWTDVAVLRVEDLATAGPHGAPVVAVAADPLTVPQARAIAGLAGAGRPVALVSRSEVPEESAAWLPPSVTDDVLPPPAVVDDHAPSHVAAIDEPALEQFPVLRGSTLGTLVVNAAVEQGVNLHMPEEDPHCALTMWDTPAGYRPAIWVFGDPSSQESLLVETTVGYDPDPDWVAGRVEAAPMAVHLYHLLAQAEKAAMAGGIAAAAAKFGMDPEASSGFLRLQVPPDPNISVDQARGSLLAALGPRRVAVRRPDGTNEPPDMVPPPRQAVWVGYEVPTNQGSPALRLAMEQLIHLVDLCIQDPSARRRLRVHGT